MHAVLESDVEEQEDNMLSDNDRKSLVLQIVENPYMFSICSIRKYRSILQYVYARLQQLIGDDIADYYMRA